MEVRGFADQLPRKPEAPFDPSNRRISLIVAYLDNKDKEEDTTANVVSGMEQK